ncbi:HNH endonuclease signature motif containing protein [Candidatus Poriferisodalis sp.]|uniref:HNH endonuclease signature motif containing protein n=1 Tax=Candidatus Poriferisodalis sp. TaxID=3101277 RepID=UPI003B0253EB
MFSQVQQALESLSAALDGVATAPTGELRRALGLAKSLRTKAELLEARAASLVAQRERHGDGGAGLLSQVGGRSRSEAARNVRVTAELAVLPDAQSAVADGEISFANAAKLAQAARKTSPEAVQDDAGLVEMAKALPADEFAQVAQRWTIQHQSVSDLEEQHRRNRRNRSVRFWNGEDGTVQMRGAFDAEMGARIQSRLRATAEQLRRTDRRKLRDSTHAAEGTADLGESEAAADETKPPGARVEAVVRTRDQRMADALDRLLAGAPSAAAASTSGGAGPTAAPAIGPATGSTAAAAPAAGLAAATGPTAGARVAAESPEGPTPAHRPSAAAHSAVLPSEAAEALKPTSSADDLISLEQRRTVTEIVVRADLDALLGKPGGIAEIAGAGPIPPSTLDRLLCGADLSLVLCGADFTPLYEAVASRAPTAAQRRALIARDGACIGCGEPPGECEAHHIIPWKSGGKTRVDNLVLVCWSCHDLIHDHNWRVVVRDGRFRLAPPDPAHPHNPARSRKPAHRSSTYGSMQSALSGSHADGRDHVGHAAAGCADDGCAAGSEVAGCEAAGCAARARDGGGDGFPAGDGRSPPEPDQHDLFTAA